MGTSLPRATPWRSGKSTRIDVTGVPPATAGRRSAAGAGAWSVSIGISLFMCSRRRHRRAAERLLIRGDRALDVLECRQVGQLSAIPAEPLGRIERHHSDQAAVARPGGDEAITVRRRLDDLEPLRTGREADRLDLDV